MNSTKMQAGNKLPLYLDGQQKIMTALQYLSSAGLRAFLAVPKAMTGTNGITRAISVNPDILEFFQITGCCGVLEITA